MLDPITQHVIAGTIGGLIGELGRNQNVLVLPHRAKAGGIDLGFINGMLIGGFVGYIVDHNPALSGIAGYIGIKFVDYLVHQLFPDYVEQRRNQRLSSLEKHNSNEDGKLNNNRQGNE